MPTFYLPGGKSRTEKYIRAEQKNRLERTRLDLNHKFFDREAYRTKFRIDREKKLILRAHDLVKRTSGISEEGCPPRDKYDREYEKSMVFQNGIRLNDLRLNSWRSHEKDLHAFLANVQRDMDKIKPSKSTKLHLSEDAKSQQSGKEKRATQKRVKSAGHASVRVSESSYTYLSDEDDDDSSVSSENSDVNSISCSDGFLQRGQGMNRDGPQKRVMFVRPHTTGTLLKRKSAENETQAESESVSETTHFLVTKGGVMMNTGGKYKAIRSPCKTDAAKREVLKTEKLSSMPSHVTVKPKGPSVKRFLSDADMSLSSLDSFPAELADDSDGRQVFSPCSENSSLVFHIPDAHCRTAPSPIGNIPIRTNIPSGRPNSRLGIFLPPEREFTKRQHYLNRQMSEFGKETDCSPKTNTHSSDWKNRLILGPLSNVHIRSLSSMATVIRAAQAFSKSRRQTILNDILTEKQKHDEESAKEEKMRRIESFSQAPDIKNLLRN